MNTATQTSANKGDTLRTKSEKPWTIESIGAELSGLTEEQIAKCGKDRPEVEEGSTVLGEAPEAMKRFFTLAEFHRLNLLTFLKEKKSKFDELESTGEDDEEICHHSMHRVAEGEEKINLLMTLGWISVRDTFGWTCENSYGVREDWKIVEPAPKTKDSFAELLGLGNLFGEPLIGIEIGPDGIKKII